MFHTKIVNSDPFLSMPSSCQLLYFHLGLHCDDDGFVYPKSIMRMIGANEDDLNVLLVKKFLISFETGVVVQKHWNINNKIRSDKRVQTSHQKEFKSLLIDSGNVYRLTDNILSGLVGTGSVPKQTKKQTNKDFSF